VRIEYPSRVYDNILSHFEIDDIQKEDFNQDLSTTEYLEDLGPPPPRYSIDFVSGQLGILILEVPSAELDTARYRQKMKGLRPKKDADEILRIKLYMREKFVRYRNNGGEWAFEPFNDWRNAHIVEFFLLECLQIGRAEWALQNHEALSKSMRFIESPDTDGVKLPGILERFDFRSSTEDMDRLREETGRTFLRLPRESELTIRGINAGLIGDPDEDPISREGVIRTFQSIAHYYNENKWRKDRCRARAEEKASSVMGEESAIMFDELRERLIENSFAINDMFAPDQRYDTGKQIDLLPFVKPGKIEGGSKEWWENQDAPIVFTKTPDPVGAIVLLILCSPLLFFGGAINIVGFSQPLALLVTIPITGLCWGFLLLGVVAGALVKHTLTIDGKNDQINHFESLPGTTFYDVDHGSVKLSKVSVVRTWGINTGPSANGEKGPPPSNKVVICRYPNKNSKTDLDVSWLFTAGKLDSKELAWTLGVPWKPRRANPKGSYPGGGLNPDW